jgi:hypothetical protein
LTIALEIFFVAQRRGSGSFNPASMRSHSRPYSGPVLATRPHRTLKILYPAGRYFMLLDGGKLGFHSCYDSRSLAEQPECTEDIAKFAASNGFPYGSLKIFASLAGPAEMYWVTNVLAYCYGMERFIGEPAPITISTLCPYVRLTLITAKFREPDRPLGPSFDCREPRTILAFGDFCLS